MSYQVPVQWSHGNQPAAAQMQKYSDALVYLDTIFGGTAHNWAVPYSLYADTQEFWFVHSQRYLVYVSSGRIVDPSGANDDVSLSSSGTHNGYDLDTIAWLAYGDLYQVIGCSACLEDGIGV